MMNLKKCLLYTFLVFTTLPGFAQTVDIDADSLGQMLKQNGLLVRLKTSENLINALEKQERKEEAKKIRTDQYKKNREIMQAFRENYTFGPVFFFFSPNSTDITQHKFGGILLNDSMQASPGIKGPEGVFFVAEIGPIPSQTDNSSTYGLHLMTMDYKNLNVSWRHRFQSVGEVDVFRLRIRKPADMVEDFNFRLMRFAEKRKTEGPEKEVK